MDCRCSDAAVWRDALASYQTRVESLSLAKTDLVRLDNFYTKQLPLLLRHRNPTPYISKPELSTLMQWKLTRGKWRPRLMDFVSSLNEPQVQSASERAFQSLPDIAKAITELTTLKGVGPATASAVLAAYSPEIAPFMSDEAMVAAIGSSKDYTLKQYLIFAEKLQTKAKHQTRVGGAYGSPDAPYPPVGQGGGFVEAYGRPWVQMSCRTSMEVTKPYGGNSAVADAGIVASASGSASGGWGGTYDTVRGVPFRAQK